FQFALTEHLRHQAHVFVNQERSPRPVASHNARAFRGAMWEREKSVVGQDRGIGMAKHAEKPALMLRKCLAFGWLRVVDLASCGLMRLVWRDHTKTSMKRQFIQRV